MSKYAVIIEHAESNYAAYVPDLPGCIATGVNPEETEREICDAIEFHLEGMRSVGEQIPEPTTLCRYVYVEAPVEQTAPSAR